MKLSIKVLITTLLLIGLDLYGQTEYDTEYELSYEFTYHLDSLNIENVNKETMYLFSGSEFGVYMNKQDAIEAKLNDIILKDSGSLEDATEEYSNYEEVLYKNLQTGSVVVFAHIMEIDYSYLVPNLPLNWELLENTKKLQGFQLHKATTSYGGRDYEAWFTLEIPIADGPYVFSGLPGLIVELYDTKKHYHFVLN